MRDTRKSNKYFIDFLDYQYSRIEKKVSKLKDADYEKKQRILVSLANYEVDLLKAEFSSGSSKEDIKTLLNRAILIISDYENVSYDDLLSLLSLAVIVEEQYEAIKLVNVHIEKIKSDRLLNYLSMYINDETPIWDGQLKLAHEYELLDEVMSETEKEKAMRCYLDAWYGKHFESSWYNSHLSDSDTYCGYWSFESAAIVKILNLNEKKFSGVEFYPEF